MLILDLEWHSIAGFEIGLGGEREREMCAFSLSLSLSLCCHVYQFSLLSLSPSLMQAKASECQAAPGWMYALPQPVLCVLLF